MYDISVIVPIYNVEEYLPASLDSLLRQSSVSLQVILVDDGSTDRSGEIAAAYAEKYSGFEYHRITTGGPGRARNVGVSYARGKYLAFVDGDDVISDGIYERMLRRAERDGSELTICFADRFNSKKHWHSPLHDAAFREMTPISHIRQNPRLLYDLTVWNKLILRSFFTRNKIAFPEDILYEDVHVALSLHCLANQVSLLFGAGYHWRVREGGSKSITQRTDNMRNLNDKITCLRRANWLLAETVGDPALLRAQQVKTLEIDMMIFVRKCRDLPRKEALAYLKTINEYLAEAIDESTYHKLRIIDRQKYEHVRKNDLDGLLALLSYKEYDNAPVTERDGGLYVDLPGDLFSVSDGVFTEEMGRALPHCVVDSVRLSEKELALKVFIYRDRYNIAREEDQRVRAWLLDEVSGVKMPMRQAFFDASSLTEEAGTVTEARRGISTDYCYDGTGAVLSFDLENADKAFWTGGRYNILIEAESRYFSDRFFLAPEGSAFSEAVGKTVICGDASLTVREEEPQTFLLEVDRRPVLADSIFFRDGELRVELNEAVAGLWVKEKGGERVVQAKKVDAGCEAGRHMSPEECVGPAAEGCPSEAPAESNGNTYAFAPSDLFDLQLELYADLPAENGNVIRKRVLARGKMFEMLPFEGGVAFAGSMGDGGIRLTFRRRAAVVDRAARVKQHFELSARVEPAYSGEVSKCVLKMEAPLEGKEIVVAKGEWESGRCSFSFGFTKHAARMYSGKRQLFIELAGPDGGVTRLIPYGIVPCNKNIQLDEMTVRLKRSWFGEVLLQVSNDWSPEENSVRKRRRLIVERYPAFRGEEMQPKTILLESARGAEVGGTPRAVYEYIIHNYPEYRCVWALKDPKMPVPGKALRVKRGSLEYYHYLATFQFLISNESLPNLFVRREGQTEILITGEGAETPAPEAGETFSGERDVLRYIRRNKRSGYLAIPAIAPETLVRQAILDPVERVKTTLRGLF